MGSSVKLGTSGTVIMYYYLVIIMVISSSTSMKKVSAAADALAEECSDSFQKLPTCLTFATGKATDPTKDCCTSVTSIKDSKPVCLCYIIQQINTGTNSQLKSLGIQEAKLLALPSACKLSNASLSDCPKLLSIPANSPGAAIFKDPSPTSTSTSTSATKATPAAPVQANDDHTSSSSSSASSSINYGLIINPVAGFVSAIIVSFALANFT